MERDIGQVRLNTSKNGEPRTFPLRDRDGELTDLGQLIEKRWRLRTYKTKSGEGFAAFVFHVQGRRVWDFSRRWKAATTAASLPGRLFHDYRRTAARDLIRSGVPQSIAMSMTGHKTDAVFRRYNITDDRDKQEAVAKVEAYRATRPKAAKVVPLAQGRA